MAVSRRSGPVGAGLAYKLYARSLCDSSVLARWFTSQKMHYLVEWRSDFTADGTRRTLGFGRCKTSLAAVCNRHFGAAAFPGGKNRRSTVVGNVLRTVGTRWDRLPELVQAVLRTSRFTRPQSLTRRMY